MKKVVFCFLICIWCCFVCEATGEMKPSVRIAKYKGDKKCAVSYTFDDGMREHYTLLLSQLEKHRFKGTFWICGDFIENNQGEWLNLVSGKGNGGEGA